MENLCEKYFQRSGDEGGGESELIKCKNNKKKSCEVRRKKNTKRNVADQRLNHTRNYSLSAKVEEKSVTDDEKSN